MYAAQVQGEFVGGSAIGLLGIFTLGWVGNILFVIGKRSAILSAFFTLGHESLFIFEVLLIEIC